MWGKLLQGARRGNCPGGKADTREPLRHEEVPMTPFWGHSTAMSTSRAPENGQKKPVNSILQCDKRFGFVFSFSHKANLICFVHGRRAISDQQYSPELQSSQVQSRAAVYTQPFLSIVNFTHTVQNPRSFLENPFHKSLHKNNSSESDTF